MGHKIKGIDLDERERGLWEGGRRRGGEVRSETDHYVKHMYVK